MCETGLWWLGMWLSGPRGPDIFTGDGTHAVVYLKGPEYGV